MAYFFDDYVFAAKYPFSRKAKEIMGTRSVEISDFVAESGFNRLSAALKAGISRKLFVHEQDAVEEILSYAAARMILSYMRNRFLTNRYAVAEAKKASAYLEGEGNEENVAAIAADMGIFFSQLHGAGGTGGDAYETDLAQFLMFAPRDIHYKLVFRAIRNGMVEVTSHERIRLVEEAVKKRMEAVPPAQGVPPSIKKVSERLYAMLPKIEPQKLTFKEGENPPCIESILEMFRKHENVGHTGRWLLAVYLINKGMGTEDMLKIFSNAPDYSEKIATYQIEHARKRGYKMPSCSSLVSYGYCIAECGLKNPMSWKRRAGARPAARPLSEAKGGANAATETDANENVNKNEARDANAGKSERGSG